jgi:hypothetical protein
MQITGSIVICGSYARCIQLSNACIVAGIHPTLLMPAGPGGDQPEGIALHTTTDPFSCVADMVVDCSDDDPETVIARCNQLSEINHGDVVFALNADMPELEKVARLIMHPGRVVGIRWEIPDAAAARVISTPLTTDIAMATAFLFLESLRQPDMR